MENRICLVCRTFVSDEAKECLDEPRAPDRGPFMTAQNDIGSVLVSMLAKIPGVVVKRKLTSADFTVKKEVFAFTKGDGVVLKLSRETIKGSSGVRLRCWLWIVRTPRSS